MSVQGKNDPPNRELASFEGLWPGGYWAADPLDPHGSVLGIFGQIGTSHATYLRCIKPYVSANSRVLEIGPGRGAWTRTLLQAEAVHCLDALSAEHNAFWEHVGRRSNVTYHQVRDFTCGMLPDNFYTFLFSYDALCHVSFEGISAYARNLFPKLQPGANCFLMVADYLKYNAFIEKLPEYSVARVFRRSHRLGWLRAFLVPIDRVYARRLGLRRPLDPAEDQVPRPGRWYHAGAERTCRMLEAVGYRVLDQDVGTDYRSPIIHFTRQ